MDQVFQKDFEKIRKCLDPSGWNGSAWLITGATGMIMSYLVKFLSWLNENEFDNSMNFTVIHRSDIDKNHINLGSLIDKSYVQFVQSDLSRSFQLPDYEYDYVIHGASNASPKSYLADPIGTINTNVNATQQMLEWLKYKPKLRSFMYVSSGQIYGDVDVIPTPEDYRGNSDHLDLRSCYTESKRFAETLCSTYCRQYSMPVKIVRPIHVYGPGLRKSDSRVWADFIIKLLEGKDIDIWSDGLSRRGLCYIADAIVQMLLVLQKGDDGSPYNVGTEEDISIKELAQLMVRQLSPNNKIIIHNKVPYYLHGSPDTSCPSISKVKSLGKLLNTSLQEGITNTFIWCQEHYK